MTDKTDIVTWLRSILHNDRSVELHCKEAADEIERLREERNECRRNFCELVAEIHSPDGLVKGSDFAKSYGWDCFHDKNEADANNTLFNMTDGE
jgi:hypothetical protein